MDVCASCGTRKLLQARGRCFACYKREWRARRGTETRATPPAEEGMLRTA
jgi:hypothetical protein